MSGTMLCHMPLPPDLGTDRIRIPECLSSLAEPSNLFQCVPISFAMEKGPLHVAHWFWLLCLSPTLPAIDLVVFIKDCPMKDIVWM